MTAKVWGAIPIAVLSTIFGQTPAAPGPPAADKIAWLSNNAVSIRSIDPRDQDFADLHPLARAIGNARIVLLGGSNEAATVDAKDRLVRFLHEQMGFDILAGDANLFDAEEFDRAMDRGAAPPEDLQETIAQTLAAGNPDPSGVLTALLNQPMRYGGSAHVSLSNQSDVLGYARATHKTARPLHIAGLDTDVSAYMRASYARQLLQFVDRVGPHLALPADRKAVQSLLNSLAHAGPSAFQPWDKVLVTAKLCDGLGRLSPDSPDASQIAFYRHTLADLGFQAAEQAQRPLSMQPKDPLVWIAKVWRPESKIVVWSSNGTATRDTPVCRELGTAVYAIAWSEIKDANSVLQILEAGPQPSLAPAEGDLESLLHALGEPYSFVDFRSLPQDHWLWQPLAARLVADPGIASWPSLYDGVLSIDLAALKDRKK
jgi:hypothetical protein